MELTKKTKIPGHNKEFISRRLFVTGPSYFPSNTSKRETKSIFGDLAKSTTLLNRTLIMLDEDFLKDLKNKKVKPGNRAILFGRNLHIRNDFVERCLRDLKYSNYDFSDKIAHDNNSLAIRRSLFDQAMKKSVTPQWFDERALLINFSIYFFLNDAKYEDTTTLQKYLKENFDKVYKGIRSLPFNEDYYHNADYFNRQKFSPSYKQEIANGIKRFYESTAVIPTNADDNYISTVLELDKRTFKFLSVIEHSKNEVTTLDNLKTLLRNKEEYIKADYDLSVPLMDSLKDRLNETVTKAIKKYNKTLNVFAYDGALQMAFLADVFNYCDLNNLSNSEIFSFIRIVRKERPLFMSSGSMEDFSEIFSKISEKIGVEEAVKFVVDVATNFTDGLPSRSEWELILENEIQVGVPATIQLSIYCDNTKTKRKNSASYDKRRQSLIKLSSFDG